MRLCTQVLLATGAAHLPISIPFAHSVGRASNHGAPIVATYAPRAITSSPLNAATVSAPPAGQAFFPLDEQLALLPGRLTPRLHEWLVRLGTWMPFAQAADLLAEFTQVRVSEPTARRQTEAAGMAAVNLETAAAERILHEYPPPPVGPPRLVVSADGAMVPLLHGVWAEVRTLAIGEPEVSAPDGEVHTRALSYFSRLTDAETFGHLALAEISRRGVLTAEVATVMDGAEWLQGFTDLHCDRAVRILDFAHAAQRIAEIGQAVWGEGSPGARQWTSAQVHALKHVGPPPVLAALRTLQAQRPELEVLAANLAYLEKREAQMDYPHFQTAGWPIGSGMVESANKLVVEARLKGAGMHWAREHVNPMLALRTISCSARWQACWPDVRGARRPVVGQRRKRRIQQQEAAARQELLASQQASRPIPQPKTIPGTSRPAANHPWKRPFSPRALQHSRSNAKR